jgi:protein-S-isoprenylcysteine O-methyltransferase Ste14
MPRFLDWPPVWTLLFAALAWGAGRLWPVAVPGGAWIGGALVALGILLMLWAVLEMTRRRTTVIPRQEPAALVTTGPFALSRNPIYLGDALIVAGVALIVAAPYALVLVPFFMILITHRFITGEEARLAGAFGAAYGAWAVRVRRWL